MLRPMTKLLLLHQTNIPYAHLRLNQNVLNAWPSRGFDLSPCYTCVSSQAATKSGSANDQGTVRPNSGHVISAFQAPLPESGQADIHSGLVVGVSRRGTLGNLFLLTP